MQRTLGPDHPDTLATWFSVAQEMVARGDHAGACRPPARPARPGSRCCNLSDPDTLITWFSIAQEMAACGDHAGAEAEYRGYAGRPAAKAGPD